MRQAYTREPGRPSDARRGVPVSSLSDGVDGLREVFAMPEALVSERLHASQKSDARHHPAAAVGEGSVLAASLCFLWLAYISRATSCLLTRSLGSTSQASVCRWHQT